MLNAVGEPLCQQRLLGNDNRLNSLIGSDRGESKQWRAFMFKLQEIGIPLYHPVPFCFPPPRGQCVFIHVIVDKAAAEQYSQFGLTVIQGVSDQQRGIKAPNVLTHAPNMY